MFRNAPKSIPEKCPLGNPDGMSVVKINKSYMLPRTNLYNLITAFHKMQWVI